MWDAKSSKAFMHNPKIRTGTVTAGKQTETIKQTSKQTRPSSPRVRNLNLLSFSSAAELLPGFVRMSKQTWKNSFSFYKSNSNALSSCTLCLKANKTTSDLSWILSDIVGTILKQNVWFGSTTHSWFHCNSEVFLSPNIDNRIHIRTYEGSWHGPWKQITIYWIKKTWRLKCFY